MKYFHLTTTVKIIIYKYSTFPISDRVQRQSIFISAVDDVKNFLSLTPKKLDQHFSQLKQPTPNLNGQD